MPAAIQPALPSKHLFADWNVPWRIWDVLKALLGCYLSVQACGLVVAVLLGAGFGFQGLGPPPAFLLRNFLSTPFSLEYWLIVQFLLSWLWVSGTILKPYNLQLKQFVSTAQSVDDPIPSSRERTQLAEDLQHGSRAFLVSLGLVVGVLGLTLAIVWFTSLQGGETPAQAIDGYLKLKRQESASLLNQQLGWLRTALIVFVAPSIEELLFRGCLFAALRKRFGFWRSALISAALFAILHRQYLVTLPQVALIGLTCAYVFEQTRSLRAAVIMHACWNLLGVLVVNPWTAAPILAAGAGVWFWVRKSMKPSARRTGWKWYLAVFTLALMIGYSLDAQIAWQAVMELPLLIAIGLYAWKQPAGSAVFWRVYGMVYPIWTVFLLRVNSIPETALPPWQRIFISSEPIRSTGDLIIDVAGYTLFVVPGLVAVWRIGLGRHLLSEIQGQHRKIGAGLNGGTATDFRWRSGRGCAEPEQ